MADDLVEWLTKLLDEDEAWASSFGGLDDPYPDPHEPGCPAHHDSLLADIAAKRTIIAMHFANGRNILGYPVCDACTPLKPVPCPTLRLLALAYSDRPGYHEEWRP